MGKQSKKKQEFVGKGKVTPVQVAFIVDRYLSDNNYANTRSAFRSEASHLIAKSPVQEAKIDKETCTKVIEAAETVKDGTKEVVGEVKRVGKAVTDKIVNTTGNVVADVAKKRLERASDNAETGKGQDLSDTVKVAAEAIKEKTDKN